MGSFQDNVIVKKIALFISRNVNTREERKFDEGGEVRVRTDEIKLIRIDRPDSATIFEGRAIDFGVLQSSAAWQIKRETIQGLETVIEFVNNGKYNQVWNNRATLLPPVPFINIFSIQFDGVNDFLSIPDDPSINFNALTDAFSFSMWVKSTQGNRAYFDKGSGNTFISWYVRNSRIVLEMRSTSSANRIEVENDANLAALSDGAWHLWTTTYDGSGNASGVTHYLDGVALTPTVIQDNLSSSTANSDLFAIGSRSVGNNFFQGNLDEPAIFNIELSSANVTTIYNAGIPISLLNLGAPISTGLVSGWRMGDDPSDIFPTIVDIKGTNDATMTNMTAGDIESESP